MSMYRILAGVFLLTVLIAGAYYFSQGKQLAVSPNTFDGATTTPEAVEIRHVPEEWREYQNASYHFSLLYPQELEVNEHREGDSAITIIFQNVESGEGFQIFILPYSEAQVSEERFKMDIPSGVRTDVANITVDGVTGAAFHSINAILGETREIWFIHGGWLYEVTTLKPLEAWLGNIMQSWKFIR